MLYKNRWIQWLLGFSLALGVPIVSEGGQWRWAAGAQLDPASHGIIDIGYRTKSVSLQLLTDTVDLRYRHKVERGQWEVGLRGALFGAELLFSPWEEGRPAPEQALRASYAGLDLSRAWWLSGGMYVGLLGEFRLYQFGQWKEATRVVPDERGRLRAAAKWGIWRSTLRTEVLSGFVQDGDTPGFWVEAKFSIPTSDGFGLLNQSYLGWSRGLTRLSRFRLGGLNPYVVPFAGMGWAEYWVERYAVQRAGFNFRVEQADQTFEVAAGADVGLWDDESLRISPMAIGTLEVGADKWIASGGVIAFEEAKLQFGGWSLFVWYERTWQ